MSHTQQDGEAAGNGVRTKASRRQTRAALVGLALLGLGIVLFFVGRLTAESAPVNVIVRRGAPDMVGTNDALLVIDDGLVDRLIEEQLASRHGNVHLSDVMASFTGDGIQISGRASLRISSRSIGSDFSVLAHPYARQDGHIGVRLTDIRAGPIRLPAELEPIVATVIDSVLADTVRIEDYRVHSIEVGKHQLFVSLVHAAPTARAS